MKNSISKTVLTLTIMASLFLGLFAGSVFAPKDVEVKEVLVPYIVEAASNETDLKLDEMYEEMFMDDSKEELAKEMIADLMKDRDFDKEVMDFLNANGESIESYKDIESYSIKDIDVVVAGDKVSAVYEIKVYYYNDGDDDEEDLQKAKFEAEFDGEDFDEEEAFDDAEMELADLIFLKKYE